MSCTNQLTHGDILDKHSKINKCLSSQFENGIVTLTMNNPERLNGWTLPMIESIRQALNQATENDSVKAVIFSGNGQYFSAGVDLGGSLKPMHPRKLHRAIVELNQQLFETFLLFPKPILVAVNGPAIGASVTSATLCDGIIASERATFSTPFSRLGVPPEGCSSYLFPRLLGNDNAKRMLEEEGWKPNAEEAHAIGLVQWVAPHEQLLAKANDIVNGWISESKSRSYLTGAEKKVLLEVNAKESIGVADGILSAAFFLQQARFFRSKRKYSASFIFYTLWALRPVWAKFL